MKRFALGLVLAAALGVTHCGDVIDDAKNLGEIVFDGGGAIPRNKLGVGNEFFPNPKGDAPAQGADIVGTLGIRNIRTTFFFDQSFLASEGSSPNFTRFDQILGSIPPGANVLPILAYAPPWLANRPDWKSVFLNRYVIPVLDRYGNDPRIGGWEIWNEPDGFCNGGFGIVPRGVLDCSAEDYVDLVRVVAPAIRARTRKPIVGAASTSIQQSFDQHLKFNRRMVAAGLLDLIDVYNFHWFGSQLERLALGVEDFLNSTGKPVWCTESGRRGSTQQLGHARDVFPTLDDRIKRLERIYIFTYFDNELPDVTFGLVARNGIESDLYQRLRDG